LEEREVLDLLTGLVDKSLVIADHKLGDETRFTLLEIVRQYAREKLSAEGLAPLSDRHCDYYCWLAEQAEPRLRSAERLTWTNKMILERHNVQQALEWAFSQGDPHAGLRIIIALANRLWQPCEQTAQTVYWVKEGVKRAKDGLDLPPLMLVRLLSCGTHLQILDTIVDFKTTVDEVIALCQQIGSQADADLSFTLSLAVFYYSYRDDKTAVRSYIELCLEVVRRLQPVDVWFKAWAYYPISWAYAMYLEEHSLACQYALESWQLFQQAGDRWLVTHLFVLGHVVQAEGIYEKARQCYQEAFLVFREVDDLVGMSQSLAFLADLELTRGDPGRARHAARLLGAVEAVHGHWSLKDLWKDEKADFFYPQTMNNLRRWLDPDELDAAWAEGAAMTVDEVYEYVLEERETLPIRE
jgi:tetratricopeptide (TPR) repeat protein